MDQPPRNQQLVDRCLRGDSAAWTLLVDRYVRLVYSVPARHGLTQSEVEDVAQDVFLSLFRNLAQIEDPEALPAWLLTTARHRSWRIMQKRLQDAPAIDDDLRHDMPTSSVPTAQPMPSMAQLLENWSQRELLSTGLDRLGQRCRALLTLLFLDDDEPSYDQIGEQLGISTGSIGPTRRRCLQQMRDILEGLGMR